MGSNRKKRQELEAIYGEGCMFEKSKAEEYISTLPYIKGFKKFIKERHFTSKEIAKLKKRMNYHHLEHRADGGVTSVDNGAIINELAHRYMHSLPRQHEEIVNNHIRQWKADFIVLTAEKVINSQEVDIDLSQDYIEIPVKEYRKPIKKPKSPEERKQQLLKQRKEEKREMQRLKKEFEER